MKFDEAHLTGEEKIENGKRIRTPGSIEELQMLANYQIAKNYEMKVKIVTAAVGTGITLLGVVAWLLILKATHNI